VAITSRAAGSWALYQADGTVAIPAAQVTGDLVVVLAGWKDYAITASISGYTEIAEYADGTTSAAANIGSVKAAAWYKVATSDAEADPTLDFSSNPTTGGAVVVVFQKGAGEEWQVPTYTTAAIASATNWTATGAANLNLAAGDLLVGLAVFRDDSATMTRSATTGLDAAGITWTGDVTEYPATHFSNTTGFDLSADGTYRIASSGTSSAAPTQTGTLAASETGAALWLRIRVATATSASAGVATGTAAANADTAKVEARGTGLSTATGAAYTADGLPAVRGLAGLSTATGTAYGMTSYVKGTLAAAAGTGSTQAAWGALGVYAGLGASTGAALDATAETAVGAITFNAEVATATAAALAGNVNLAASLGFAQGRSS
jgi:hypothetical protein